jgi:chemotaxis methyl-accepting protein methylase
MLGRSVEFTRGGGDPVAVILALLRERSGVDFGSYRRPFIERRILTRMTAAGVRTFAEYLDVLSSSEREAAALVSRLTIKVSRFYRDAASYDLLRRQVLPELARLRTGAPLHIWCAGAGRGEEPYTFAILLEHLGLPGRIEATDIDPGALEAARRAIYSQDAVATLPSELLHTHFEPTAGNGTARWAVTAAIKRRVRYSLHDVTSETPPPSRPFDLISCRNVLIYVERNRHAATLARLRGWLAADGYLCLGEAEWPPPMIERTLQPVKPETRIFRAAAPSQSPS